MKDLAGVFIMQGKRFCAVVSILFICFMITVCNLSSNNSVRLTYDEAVKKVTFSGNAATVDFTNLNRHDIYLVKINSSDFVVPTANTGGIAQALSVITPEGNSVMPHSAAAGSEDSFYRFHMEELERSANPPPIDMERGAVMAANFAYSFIGDKRNFWVERDYHGGDWVNSEATLIASGVNGNIWVMDENTSSGTSENKISKTQAEDLAGKFDRIYSLTTNILGYEYGGGPDGNGGVDEDKKIQILVYDFYGPDHESEGTKYAGFFSSKDFYTQAEIDRWGWESKTNLAEMFYVDAGQVNNSPNYTYSLLIHEFQHMINFNRKYVEHSVNANSWYNEMLSTMAEDVIAPLIGIGRTNTSHPISVRIPRFLDSYYMHGITEWDGTSNNYAKAYAFGAYLMRNYGGPELLGRILHNDKANVDSITLALKEFSWDMDFETALHRYGEAMIFSGSSMPEGVVTFDRTVTSTINGQEYTAYGINIWQTRRYSANVRGPVVLNMDHDSMRPHSVIVQSVSQWNNKTGNFSITLEKPSNQNVVLYLLAR